MLPAGFRQRDQTKKSPTGPFDREALQQHLEKLALEHEDREDLVPFTGEKKGEAAGVLSDTHKHVLFDCTQADDDSKCLM